MNLVEFPRRLLSTTVKAHLFIYLCWSIQCLKHQTDIVKYLFNGSDHKQPHKSYFIITKDCGHQKWVSKAETGGGEIL